jgi:hypothetical protein
MAIITLVHTLDGSWSMARWLANRTLTSWHMAIRAGSGRNADVIPTRRYERAGSMTMVTRVGRFLSTAVTGRLAKGDPPVMTSSALLGQSHTMVVSCPKESVSIEVTAFAWCIGHDVAI